MNDTDRRLLIIAFHYPPDNTSTGVLRTLKFTQYLGDYGWQCDVVSVPERIYYSSDPGSVAGIPESTRVYRPWGADTKRLFGVRGRYPSWLGIPDRYWPWILPAFRCASRLLRAGDPYRAVYSTYPVPSALLVGLLLKRRHGLPWVVDFRDPWVEDSMPRARRLIEGYWERRVLFSADRVICNTPRMRDWFLSRYPALDARKLVTITNGYDAFDLAGVVPLNSPKFEILYSGIISPSGRNPRPLLAAARRALDLGWLDEGDLGITFLGAGDYGMSREFRRDVAEFGLESVVEVTEQRIPYREALRRSAGADVVLVMSEPAGDDEQVAAEKAWMQLQVPVKVYEGLGLRRRILALVSGGAISDLLAATRSGVTVSPSDIDGIANALRSFYEESKSGVSGAVVNMNELAAYERRRLAGMLAAELNQVAAAGGIRS